jgi:endonuclease/exonuclease/phosphatase family metal-dependent hydrolase
MNGVSIVTLNIEHDQHLAKIQNFFLQRQPNVILLQEVLRRDIHIFRDNLGYECIFTGLGFVEVQGTIEEIGLLTGSKLPILDSDVSYYFGNSEDLHLISLETITKMARAIIRIEVQSNGQTYCIANTHFTWTPDGKPTPQQHIDYKALLNILRPTPEFVLCGDFNAPRGTTIFDNLACIFKDNIPLEVTSTLDKKAHKAGHLNLVVDGVFSTPKYKLFNITVISDLSDHCAIYGEVAI